MGAFDVLRKGGFSEMRCLAMYRPAIWSLISRASFFVAVQVHVCPSATRLEKRTP